ncbi:hypothetical protein KIH74_22890 [Kineosporia sp. J2-2]|uniref:Phage-related protein n=1 Tax=Kineosporia corallincola TaxID=2835133 RepID=A0ABS5TNM5_9ACTN|nr:hypothetical protein [Kineosporia corallincola]MBT0771806.1 hypothetical protein [Kineosporia corallincola]
MSEITVGSVSVDIVPDARQFPRRVAAQVNPEAAKIGQEFGRLFGAAAEREMAGGVRDGLRSGGRESTSQGTRDGESYGGSFGRALKARLEAAFRSLPDVEIDADSTQADRKIADIRRRISELQDKRIGVDVDARTALVEIRRIQDQLRDLGKGTTDLQVRTDAAGASAELRRFAVEVGRLDGRSVNIDVDVDTAGASAQLALMRGNAVGAQTGMLALIGAAALLGPALIPVGAAGAGAMAAIATGALVAAGGVGVLVLALAPVIAAVQAIKAAEDQTAQSARGATSAHLQMAAAMDAVEQAQRGLASAREDARVAAVQAARQVADAERSVRDAERQSARDRVDDARKVADAKRQLADAVRRAADDVEAAGRAVEDAERGVADAQRSALDAQRALADARKQAARDAEDLAARVAGGALDERDAVLRVQEAQERLAEVMADPEASDLQRQRAQLAVEEALQGLENQRRENARLAEEKAAADAAGVEGSKAVVDAQRGVVDAQERVKDAQDAASEAARNQAVVAGDSARQVADAQRGVADAERSASRRRADDARRVADAQRAVAVAVDAAAQQQRRSAESIVSAQQAVVSAQRGVQQASQSAGATGGAAMDKVRDKMAALTPEGRRFVNFLTGELFPQFSGLSDAAQARFLPGLQDGLAELKPLIPGLTTFVGDLATTMGDLAREAGKALGGPFWTDFFGYVGDVGPDLLGKIGRIIGDLVQGFAGLVKAFDPVTQDFFTGLESLTQAFSDFGTNAENNSGFQGFIAYIQEVGPQVMATLGAIGRAFGHILESLAPLGPIVLRVIEGFADFISSLPPSVIIGIAVAIGAVAAAMTIMNIAMAANPVALIIIGLVALGVALYELYQRSEFFRGAVDLIWAKTQQIISAAWDIIRPVLEAFGKFIVETLPAAFEKGIGFLSGAWSGFATAIGVTWGLIRAVFSLVWTWIRDHVIENFKAQLAKIAAGWVNFKDAVGDTWQAIKGFFSAVWTWIRDHVVENFKTQLGKVAGVWDGLKTAISETWSGIKDVFSAVWTWIRDHVAAAFDREVRGLSNIWDGLKTAVTEIWSGKYGIKTIFDAVKDYISDKVVDGFRRGVDAIGRAWDKVREIAAAPVRFVIETVINKGIIGAFNKVAGFFKLDKLDEVPVPESLQVQKRAYGGYISGPGGPREDLIPAMLSNGEYVIQANVVSRLGRSFFDYLNRGGSIGGDPGGIAKFRDGGLARRIQDTVDWLPSVDPLPYIWGAVGPGGFDCSGLAGEVWARVLDKARNTRYFTTAANFGGLGFAPGEGVYTIGVDPGVHMAGRLAGLPFEAASTASGIHVGAQARPVTTFPQVYHLADLPGGKGSGGFFDWVNPLPDIAGLFKGPLARLDSITDSPWGQLVSRAPIALMDAAKDALGDAVNPFRDGGFVEATKYDSGGYLPPGLTTVMNATGRPEPVFTAAQWADLRANGAGRGGGQPVVVTQNITNPAPETAGDSLASGMRKLALYGLVGQRG